MKIRSYEMIMAALAAGQLLIGIIAIVIDGPERQFEGHPEHGHNCGSACVELLAAEPFSSGDMCVCLWTTESEMFRMEYSLGAPERRILTTCVSVFGYGAEPADGWCWLLG